MLDTESLRPVIIAMGLYIAMTYAVPKILKKSTGIGPIDDITMLLLSQQGSLMAGSLLVGIIVLLTNYINLNLELV
jgi:hypothetical protein